MARLRYQIEQEYRAAELALHGCAAGVSKHAFITAKQVRVALLRLTGVPYTAPIALLDLDDESATQSHGRQRRYGSA